MLLNHNIYCFLTESLKILTSSSDKIESECCLPFNISYKPESIKHMLIDYFFSVLIEQRIALPVIFYGWWSSSLEKLSNTQNKSKDSVRVIDLII